MRSRSEASVRSFPLFTRPSCSKDIANDELRHRARLRRQCFDESQHVRYHDLLIWRKLAGSRPQPRAQRTFTPQLLGRLSCASATRREGLRSNPWSKCAKADAL